MIDIEDVIKELSKELNIDKEIVSIVCKHLFSYTVDIMKSDSIKDVLFNELFKFKLKPRFKKNKKQKYR